MYKKIGSFFNTIKFCIRISWKTSAVYTLLRIVFGIVSSFVPILSACVTKYILDKLILIQSEGMKLTFVMIVVLFLLKILQGILERYKAYIENVHAELMQHQLSEMLLEKTMNADLSMFDTPQCYDVLSETQKNVSALTTILWNILEVFGSFATFVSAVIILSRSSWYYALIMIMASVPSAITGQRYMKDLYRNDLEQINNMRKQNYLFQIGISQNYAQEIRCYEVGDMITQKYKHLFSEVFFPKKKILGQRSLANSLLLILSETAVLILSMHVAYRVYAGECTIGDYSMYTSMLLQLNGTIALLVIRLVAVYENKMKADFMAKFFEITMPRVLSGSIVLEKIKRIEFVHVVFAYPGTDKRTIDDVSFVLKEKSKTALIGMNGAGKSTIIKLLLRLYDVGEGCILINSRNIKEFDIKSLRRQIGIYTQNSAIFDWALGENISIGSSGYDKEICRNVLLNCGGKDVLNKCNEDMETYMGHSFSEKGIELSVGQKQKVALARAFYRQRQSLYILDEPSSSLDPEAEQKVFAFMREKSASQIVLFTSHRIASIHMSDEVLVMENGRIIERGTEEELLKQKGRFYQLYSLQINM